MSAIEFKKIAVCDDCCTLIANGELPPDSDQITDEWLLKATAGVQFDGEYQGFSVKPCDCCKRRLGGDRFTAFKAI